MPRNVRQRRTSCSAAMATGREGNTGPTKMTEPPIRVRGSAVSNASGEPVISKATSTPWPSVHSRAMRATSSGVARCVAPNVAARASRAGAISHAMTRFGAQRTGPGRRGHAEHPAAHHEHSCSGKRAGRLERGRDRRSRAIRRTGRGVGKVCRHAEDRGSRREHAVAGEPARQLAARAERLVAILRLPLTLLRKEAAAIETFAAACDDAPGDAVADANGCPAASRRDAPGPNSTMRPRASCPRTVGSGTDRRPSRLCRSLPQSVQARTSTRTSWSRNAGKGNSRISSAVPAPWKTSAVVVLVTAHRPRARLIRSGMRSIANSSSGLHM